MGLWVCVSASFPWIPQLRSTPHGQRDGRGASYLGPLLVAERLVLVRLLPVQLAAHVPDALLCVCACART